MFDNALAADNPDLRSFKAAGGKLIMWQGLADQLIFTGDSINYYNHALAANGGIHNTESFFRYFLAPSIGHCGGPGPGSIAPTNPMQQVIRRQLGVDAFALDGDESDVPDSWQDRPRRTRLRPDVMKIDDVK